MNDSGTFTCADCGGTFEKEWTDAEAEVEREANGWGDLPDEEIVVICDDCYRPMMAWADGLGRVEPS